MLDVVCAVLAKNLDQALLAPLALSGYCPVWVLLGMAYEKILGHLFSDSNGRSERGNDGGSELHDGDSCCWLSLFSGFKRVQVEQDETAQQLRSYSYSGRQSRSTAQKYWYIA